MQSTLGRPVQFPCPLIEALETRQLLSTATTTVLSASAKSAVLGEAITLEIQVRPSKGTKAPSGTVELLSGNKDTGLTGELDKNGEFSVSFTAQDALFIHDFSFGARFLGSAHFGGSKSAAVKLKITAPVFTTATDGLKTATVKPGKGTATVQSGDTVTVADTGYTAAGIIEYESGAHGNGFATFEVDATPDQTVAGIDQGIIGMKVGETRVIESPSSLAYNDGNTYYFIIQLKSIVA